MNEQETNDQTNDDTKAKGDGESFWMRESVAIKRMELLINAVIKGISKQPEKKKARLLTDAELVESSEDNQKTSKSKKKRTSKAVSDTISRSKSSPVLEPKELEEYESCSQDTDEMLLKASNAVNRKPKNSKKKKQEYHPFAPIDSSSTPFVSSANVNNQGLEKAFAPSIQNEYAPHAEYLPKNSTSIFHPPVSIASILNEQTSSPEFTTPDHKIKDQTNSKRNSEIQDEDTKRQKLI